MLCKVLKANVYFNNGNLYGLNILGYFRISNRADVVPTTNALSFHLFLSLPIMKKQKFSWLPLLIFTGYVGLYLLSCQRDAEQITTKPFTDSQVVFRDCDIMDKCHFSITTDVNATLDLCGDLPQSMTSCSGGCNSSTDTGAAGAIFVANESKVICVNPNGSVCIKNVGSTSVTVTVRFGAGAPIMIAIGVNETQCFHNDGCDSTQSHCQ